MLVANSTLESHSDGSTVNLESDSVEDSTLPMFEMFPGNSVPKMFRCFLITVSVPALTRYIPPLSWNTWISFFSVRDSNVLIVLRGRWNSIRHPNGLILTPSGDGFPNMTSKEMRFFHMCYKVPTVCHMPKGTVPI